MKWPNDTTDFALPVRDVDFGQPAESAMRLGVSGIRTVEHTQGDGSVLRLSNRGGYPLYESVDGIGGGASQTNYRRGFVAVAPGATTGTLFNPYTLAVVQHGFKPAGALYYVLDFATSWNVSPSDTTNWRDVIVFNGNKILINGLRMAPPLQDLASVPSGSVPYFMQTGLSGSQYGPQRDRRTFAIARELVKSWASGGITETLTPTTPRTDEKALTIGPGIVRSTHKAWLGQLHYTGTSATDDAGTWAFSQREVNMMLASPFLSGTNSSVSVDMAAPGLVAGVPSSESSSLQLTLPPTEIGMYSTATSTMAKDFSQRYDYYDAQVPFPSTGIFAGHFNFAGTVSRELQGQKTVNSTMTTYTGSSEGSVQITDKQFDFALSNSKLFDTMNTSTSVISQWVDYDASISEVDTTHGSNMTGNATNLYWGQDLSSPPPSDGLNARMPGPHGGKARRYVGGGKIYGADEIISHEEQTLSASVTSGAISLVTLSAFRNNSYEEIAGYTPNTTYYTPYVGSDWYPETEGMGLYGRASWLLDAYVSPSTDEILITHYEATLQYISGWGYWYKQTQETQDKINAKYQQVHNAILAQERYDDEATSGITSRTFYYGYTTPYVTTTSQALTWKTTDFILLDETNGVYISVDGDFSGQDTDATLTVSLVIKTRHDTTTIQLLTRDYTYGDLLPEYEIGTTGKYAVPSPQIRAMFVPLHREQGSFKGAHYVTLDEENNGADPAHLFSLRLILHTLSAVGKINELNITDVGVHFVPFNLLEMLYCFVFSQDYGVGASTSQRYPITETARYNDMMANLFGVPFNITVRDGVETPWTYSLHSAFVGAHGASLHRV